MENTAEINLYHDFYVTFKEGVSGVRRCVRDKSEHLSFTNKTTAFALTSNITITDGDGAETQLHHSFDYIANNQRRISLQLVTNIILHYIILYYANHTQLPVLNIGI